MHPIRRTRGMDRNYDTKCHSHRHRHRLDSFPHRNKCQLQVCTCVNA
jgi:hypothetical protein